MSLAVFTPRYPNVTGVLVPGIDVSGWQTAAQLQGQMGWVQWAYLKVSERAGFFEPESIPQRAVMDAAGKPWGPYHFAQPAKASAVDQARWFASCVKDRLGGMGQLDPCLDMEAGQELGDLSGFVEEFAAETMRLLGRDLVIYTNPSFAAAVLRAPGLRRFRLWLAHYSNPGVPAEVPAPWSEWGAWQYCDTSSLGSLDLNVARPGFLRPRVGGIASDDHPMR